MNSPRYKELDALRGFAALFVVLFHYTTHTAYAVPFLELGVTGVDLFFIISGFVIFMSIQNVSSAKEFMVNRFSRLYPTYWTVVTFTTLLYLIINYLFVPDAKLISLFKYLANMTMFQHYLRAGNIDGTYWTMIIEMVFYIFMAILFRAKLLKHILSIGAIVLVITLVWDIFTEAYFISLYKMIRYIFPLINHFPLFLAGIIFYKMATDSRLNYTHYILLGLCLPVQILLYDNGGSAQNYISQYSYAFMLLAYFCLFFLFVHQKLKFIVNKPALFFGKISFALYLIHQYLSIDIIIPILTRELHLNFWLACCIAFAVSVTLSTLITYYIEVPLGRKIKSAFSKPIAA